MPENIRALIYVLIVAVPAFIVARRVMHDFLGDNELVLWRNSWIVATLAVFLSGNFLLFALTIGLYALYVHRQHESPFHLYIVLLLVGPTVGVNISIPGVIGSLIELNPARVMALAFLLPAATMLFRQERPEGLRGVDNLVVLFVLLVVGLSLRHGNINITLRTAVVVTLDVLLPYFVFSRSITTVSGVRRALLALLFATLPFAAAAVFEMVRGWRLYHAAVEIWGVQLVQPYLFRDGMLRAAVTTIEPIACGFVCMTAIGCMIANRPLLAGKINRSAAYILVVAGLFASLSRGPWLGATMLMIFFVCCTQRGSNLFKIGALMVLLAIPFFMTSAGERVYRLLPFVGTVERSNEEYRSRLIEISGLVISRNPMFGSESFLAAPEMAELVQGQGIIDVVNTYVAIALEFGLVTLAVFVTLFGSLVVRLYRGLEHVRGDTRQMALAMMATMVAMLFTIGTVSSVSVIPYVYWTFAGLCVAFLRAASLAAEEVIPPRTIALTVLGR